MRPIGKDADILPNRKDSYFSQIVRNLKSHKTLEKAKLAIYKPGKPDGKYFITDIGTNFLLTRKEEFEYILLKQIIGGECIGNGALKQSDKTQTKEFFEKSKNFYLNLPSDLFKERNFIFKVKFALFKFALRHNLYFMPRLARVITNPLIFFYGIFFPLNETSLSGLPEE